jgi:hypothetical protein
MVTPSLLLLSLLLLLLLKLVPTLMIDDAETKMRTEASVLFERFTYL